MAQPVPSTRHSPRNWRWMETTYFTSKRCKTTSTRTFFLLTAITEEDLQSLQMLTRSRSQNTLSSTTFETKLPSHGPSKSTDDNFNFFRRTCVPKKSMPCSFRSLTYITLRVRSGFFSTCQAHTRDEFPQMKVFLLNAGLRTTRCMYTKKNVFPFSPSLMGFPHQNS